MCARYPAVYRDARGEEITTVWNDAKTLRMSLRGVEFEGRSPDDFEPTIPLDDPALSAFTLNYYGENRETATICSYTLQFDMPLPVVRGTPLTAEEATLRVVVEVGLPKGQGRLDHQAIRLTLCLDGNEYSGRGTHGWFEDELLDIQKALPDGVYMMACINCAFSDYSVYGHDVFGNLLCFRDRKPEYLQVRTKCEYMNVLHLYTEVVQETYLCPEFQRRVSGTGYRG